MANETVLFKRGDSATITSTPVTDGQILFDTSGNGKMYLDNGTDRLEMGGAITVDASLSKTSTNAIQNKAVTGNILNSLAEVSAATQQNTIAGALALKELNASLGLKNATVLYDKDWSVSTNGLTLTLSDNISNYSMIAVMAARYTDNRDLLQGIWNIVPVSLLKAISNINPSNFFNISIGGDYLFVFRYISDNEIKVASSTSSLTVYGKYVYGIK